MRRESVAVCGGKEAKETNALFPDGRLLGGVGGGEAVEERREGVVREVASYGFELGGGDGESVAVGELVETENDSLPEIAS